ncbi:MAG: hypothetical protein CM1200mP38_0370 [Dehalococcoidia bacterium]|nr:MAG: hypothetical protein CM1200mP38_0370 [Dehalococcoidia bacterium]
MLQRNECAVENGIKRVINTGPHFSVAGPSYEGYDFGFIHLFLLRLERICMLIQRDWVTKFAEFFHRILILMSLVAFL